MRDLRSTFFAMAFLGLGVAAEAAQIGAPLLTTRNSNGMVGLPLVTSEYENPATLLVYHKLPLALLYMDATHRRFIDISWVAGGSFGGQREIFDSELVFTFRQGDGEAIGPPVTIPALCETHTSPQDPGAVHQVLQTAMWSLQGNVENQAGWEYLSVTAGEAYGLPSPGVTTLQARADGPVEVTSEFNIRYRIEYRGAAGGPFEGLEGAAEGEVLMRAVPAEAASEP